MPFTRSVTPENRRLLQQIYRPSRHHAVRQRAHCILRSSQGKGGGEWVAICSVSRKTIYNWFESWATCRMAGLDDQPGRGRQPTLTPPQQEPIAQWSQELPQKLKQVLAKIKAQWGIEVSPKTVTRVLKGLPRSWQRLRRVVAGWPEAQLDADQQAELEQLKQLENAGAIDWYDLDESGFCLIP